ncbi:hypothetical protein HDU96_006933 [Phlyctochytrium bullatum]|nr:hypothetical protein HDU96_006933 [Phlyctochytrium bullatum]
MSSFQAPASTSPTTATVVSSPTKDISEPAMKSFDDEAQQSPRPRAVSRDTHTNLTGDEELPATHITSPLSATSSSSSISGTTAVFSRDSLTSPPASAASSRSSLMSPTQAFPAFPPPPSTLPPPGHATATRSRRQRALFEEAMRDPARYSALRGFAQSQHCGENFAFLECLKALENMVAGDAGDQKGSASGVSVRALDRFTQKLKGNTGSSDESSATGPTRYVQGELALLHVKLFDTFVSDMAPCQVNLPDGLRKRIEETVSEERRTKDGVPLSLFDAAADEVMEMVYRDVFQKFLRSQQQQGDFGTVMKRTPSMGAGDGTASRPVSVASSTDSIASYPGAAAPQPPPTARAIMKRPSMPSMHLRELAVPDAAVPPVPSLPHSAYHGAGMRSPGRITGVSNAPASPTTPLSPQQPAGGAPMRGALRWFSNKFLGSSGGAAGETGGMR